MQEELSDLVHGLPVAILIVILRNSIFRQWRTDRPNAWICLTFLAVSVISVLTFFHQMLTNTEVWSYRLTGPYAIVYLVMLLSSIVPPLFALNKTVRQNLWLLFTIALIMNVGFLYELFVYGMIWLEPANKSSFPQREIYSLGSGIIVGSSIVVADFLLKKFNLSFIDDRGWRRISYRPFVALLGCGLCYWCGIYLMSIYGLDPPEIFWIAGMYLMQFSILISVWLVLDWILQGLLVLRNRFRTSTSG